MVGYKNILEQYFNELKRFRSFISESGMATAELSFRPYLDNFFASLCAYLDTNIQKVFEPQMQGNSGRPDWLFTDSATMGIYGYVEAKGFTPDRPINKELYEAQIRKYLKLGNPVLLTDGIEFLYYAVDGKITRFELFSKPVKWEAPEFKLDSLGYFREFYSNVGFRTIPESMITSEMSKRAQMLCDDIVELLNLEEDETESETEMNTVKTLKRLWDNAARNLDASLSSERTFAGFISQILAFGLLYAYRFVNDDAVSPSRKYEILHYFWTHRLYRKQSSQMEPFVHLFNALSEELDSKLSRIGCWYDNARRFLSFTKLTKGAVQKPNFHQLYEVFLSTYDRDTRVDFGAWYTPAVLADFMARLVQFNIRINPCLRPLQNNPFVLIDPCCGTGTFLESALENISIPEKSMLTGFEILPVPYALANYRLSLYDLDSSVSLSVHLTNTLGDNTFLKPNYNLDTLDSVGLFFAKEQIASFDLSQPPLTIIIGNPPCSDSSVTNSGDRLNDLMKDFRPPVRKGRQNIQMQLSNEWIKFLRWGLYKAVESRPSILAFILPSTFAQNVSFKYARKYLIEHSDELSVIEFDSDNRVESANQNVFNTLQGRLLIMATLTGEGSSTFVRYKDIRPLSRSEKMEFFSKPITSLDWSVVNVDEDYSLRPGKKFDVDLYSKFIPLTGDGHGQNGIFQRHCSGLKLAPTHLLVHFSKGQLSRRCRYIGDKGHSYDEIKERWYTGQVKPPSAKKITEKVRESLAKAHKHNRKYSYRPFLEAWLNDNEGLLSELKSTEGGGMRDRPEVRAAFMHPDVIGFSVAPAPAELSRDITKFCSFCWNLPDNDLATRGNAHVYCNKFPEYKKNAEWSKEPLCNINPYVMAEIADVLGVESEKTVDDIVFYSYAILTSPYYLKKFSGKLHSLAGSTPSIPLTASRELFETTVTIGRRLAELERGDYRFSVQELESPNHIRWEEPRESFRLQGFSIRETTVCLDTGEGENITLSLPPDWLKFNVSGYNVIREWLKYHSFSYYRKDIGKEELEDFISLVNRIGLYLKEYENLDRTVRKILESQLIEALETL